MPCWTCRFARDPAIVGKPLMLDGQQDDVVGVLSADFYFPDRDTELWTPMPVAVTPQCPAMIFAFSDRARQTKCVTLAQATAEGSNLSRKIPSRRCLQACAAVNFRPAAFDSSRCRRKWWLR